MLSDEWLSRYLKNLHIKLCRSVTGMQTQTWTGVTAIALPVLRTGKLKTKPKHAKLHLNGKVLTDNEIPRTKTPLRQPPIPWKN